MENKTLELVVVNRHFVDRDTGKARDYEAVAILSPNGEISIRFNSTFERDYVLSMLKAQQVKGN